MPREYYGGASGIVDYLRPTPTRYIPLVELPKSLNPFLDTHDIHIDAKLMNTLPLGNVKSLPAWYMLENANSLRGKHIVEASSGNTVMSLGLLAKHFGAASVQAIASPDVSEGKLTLLKLADVGVTLVKGPICPNPNDPDGAIVTARKKGASPNSINLGQYDNEANPKAHETITGPQLYEQLGTTIGMFCAGLGTTGTLLGTARYLQQKIPGLKVAGVVRTANNPVPGVRTVNGLNEVAFPWVDALTEPLVEVTENEAYRSSLSMIREGLLVGPSAGFALAGVLQQLRRLERTGEIEALRGKHIVFICPDSPFPYATDYEKILGPKLFPQIENVQLREHSREQMTRPSLVPEMNVDQVLSLYDSTHSEEVNSLQMKNAILIDVREPNEFDDHHLPDSINVPLAQLPAWIKAFPDHDTRQVIFVCRTGNRSGRATHVAQLMHMNAYNMKGGTVEWSARHYPRITSPFCAT